MTLNPLGRQTDYISTYAPELLFPIARIESRRALGIVQQLPFYGQDLWTGYELSWLNKRGKPQVAVAEFVIPCDSEFIIESKSFKLYLNSLNQTRFGNLDEVRAILTRDLSAAAAAEVNVCLYPLTATNPPPLSRVGQLPGVCLDDLDVEIDCYHPHPEYLQLVNEKGNNLVEETFHSHLLKTNCPVTGQPDWASLVLGYKGRQIARDGVVRYLISFREHQDFHEHCVERIFCDLMERCAPDSLSVYARYTRRGGLDINPFRTTEAGLNAESIRLIRQ